MGDSVSKKRRRRLLPDIPEALPVAIVDNHTHIDPDPQGLPMAGGTPDALARSSAQSCGAPTQNRDGAGGLLMPVLLPTLLEGMAQAGIRGAITSGCELPLLEFSRDLARDNEQIWAALAIHPNEAAMHAGVREVAPDGLQPRVEPWHDTSYAEAIAKVAELCDDDAVVAIGETGLDYFRTGEQGKDAQKQSLRDHIALAKELGKPMQIHDRDAHADVVDILLKDGAPERTVFHCFSGDRALAHICAEQGWYASFAGPLTYPVNEDLQAAFDEMPDDLILAETDAPYLTPAPYRGHPNAVWGVAYTVRFMAERRGADLAQWCSVIDRNTTAVYGI